MTLEERVRELEYDLGKNLYEYLHKCDSKKSNNFENRIKFLFLGAVPYVCKDLFSRGKFLGRVAKDTLKGKNKLPSFGRSLYKVAEGITSPFVIGGISAFTTTLTMYKNNVFSDMPLIVRSGKATEVVSAPFKMLTPSRLDSSIESVFGVCEKSVRASANVVYCASKSALQGTTDFGKGIINLDSENFIQGLSNIEKISSLDKMLINDISFANLRGNISDNLEYAENLIFGTIAAYLTLKAGNAIYSSIKNKKEKYKYNGSVLLKYAGNILNSYAVWMLSLGAVAQYYDKNISLVRSSYKILDSGVKVLDLGFGAISSGIRAGMYGLNYLINQGFSDTVSLVAGRNAGSVVHVLDRLSNSDVDTMFNLGVCSLTAGVLAKGVSNYLHFRGNATKKELFYRHR